MPQAPLQTNAGKKPWNAYHACLNTYGVQESYDLPEGIYEQHILPVAPLLHGIKEAFADPDTGIAPPLIEIQPEKLARFEDVCSRRLSSLIAAEQPGSATAQRKTLHKIRNF